VEIATETSLERFIFGGSGSVHLLAGSDVQGITYFIQNKERDSLMSFSGYSTKLFKLHIIDRYDECECIREVYCKAVYAMPHIAWTE
jgi:hypothetical protein